mmetsp:Transcript_40337/g.72693  ORF Transcript_40337/g.72693 Transcript_40337/m.72693 type:complete len:106 (+) Transcript_40337:481-798(+)
MKLLLLQHETISFPSDIHYLRISSRGHSQQHCSITGHPIYLIGFSPTADAMDENVNANPTSVNDLSFLADTIIRKLNCNNLKRNKFVEGSVTSMLQCIASDWGMH